MHVAAVNHTDVCMLRATQAYVKEVLHVTWNTEGDDARLVAAIRAEAQAAASTSLPTGMSMLPQL